MKVIAIKHCSAGNDTVGEMWRETAIFSLDTPVCKIFEWANIDLKYRSKNHLEITLGEGNKQ